MATERLLQRPIYGGVFGQGRYALASMPCVSRGLHKTVYMVLQPDAGAVLSVSEDKVDALAGARRVLKASNDEGPQQLKLGLEFHETSGTAPDHLPTARPVSRRRQEIFDKSMGRCHYCGAALTLNGKWHVEHMLPRSLGGGDDALNLVAACVECNLAKADRTAIEFVARKSEG